MSDRCSCGQNIDPIFQCAECGRICCLNCRFQDTLYCQGCRFSEYSKVEELRHLVEWPEELLDLIGERHFMMPPGMWWNMQLFSDCQEWPDYLDDGISIDEVGERAIAINSFLRFSTKGLEANRARIAREILGKNVGGSHG